MEQGTVHVAHSGLHIVQDVVDLGAHVRGGALAEPCRAGRHASQPCALQQPRPADAWRT